MKNFLVKMLSAAALVACAAAPASAGVVYGSSFDLSYDENTMIPVSYTGNTVTFTTTFYYSQYGQGFAVVRDGLFAAAHAGVRFTGDVSIQTRTDYYMGADTGFAGPYRADLTTGVDVLSPNCANCSIYDSKLLGNGQSNAWASSPTPVSGMANGAVDIANTQGGTYDRLGLYVINNYSSANTAVIHLNTFTITLDTVGGPISSPVPELPPFALIGVGMLAIALRERLRKGRRRA